MRPTRNPGGIAEPAPGRQPKPNGRIDRPRAGSVGGGGVQLLAQPEPLRLEHLDFGGKGCEP